MSAENRQTQAEFRCVACGCENNADLASAINVLERRHHLLACGEWVQSGRSMKQEPARLRKSLLLRSAVGIRGLPASQRPKREAGEDVQLWHLNRKICADRLHGLLCDGRDVKHGAL